MKFCQKSKNSKIYSNKHENISIHKDHHDKPPNTNTVLFIVNKIQPQFPSWCSVQTLWGKCLQNICHNYKDIFINKTNLYDNWHVWKFDSHLQCNTLYIIPQVYKSGHVEFIVVAKRRNVISLRHRFHHGLTDALDDLRPVFTSANRRWSSPGRRYRRRGRCRCGRSCPGCHVNARWGRWWGNDFYKAKIWRLEGVLSVVRIFFIILTETLLYASIFGNS